MLYQNNGEIRFIDDQFQNLFSFDTNTVSIYLNLFEFNPRPHFDSCFQLHAES